MKDENIITQDKKFKICEIPEKKYNWGRIKSILLFPSLKICLI